MNSESPHDAPAPLPVLWLCGAPGAGKTVIAWELFRDSMEAQVAYIDIDQLKMLAPEPEDSFELAVANLSAFLDVHRRIGTQALIVSGVIDPEQVPVLEAGVGDRAAITWCLVDAEDDVLRGRIRDRGWPEELVELVLGDARAWRAAPHGPVIDTTSTTPAEAARPASVHLTLLPPGQHTLPGAEEHPSADTPDLVVIHGPRAVGKSTISWGLFWERAQHGEPTGYLDADQLGFVHADDALRDRSVRDAIVAMARTFAGAGAACTIVNGNLSPRAIEMLAGEGALLVQLDAPDDVITERIAARAVGDEARLTGDDLVGATPDHRAAVLLGAQRRRAELSALGTSHRLNVTDPDPAPHVSALAGLLEARRSDRL